MKRIFFELSDSDHESLKELLEKMKSKKVFIKDVILNYQGLIDSSDFNHILKKEFRNYDDNYQ